MKIFVIGGDGRAHATVWKLAQSPHVTQMWCAPGNAGIAQEHLAKNANLVECVKIEPENLDGLLSFAYHLKPDLTVVGPERPLAMGIVDLFQKNALRIWGPNQKATQFESSKSFTQRFMQKYGIPSPKGESFGKHEMREVENLIDILNGQCAVKADGLCGGKGVMICHDKEDALKAVEEMFKIGNTVVIQELLEGPEISLHAICDGKTLKLFPTSQDHKRLYENGHIGENPITGGMGAYSPTLFVSDTELANIEKLIIQPWFNGCVAEGINYRGIIYPGIMLTKDGPKVLEFNARFGDPEAQVYLTRLENDLVELLGASIDGTLDKVELKWKPESSVCVVMASGGYPDSKKFETGKVITGLNKAAGIPGTKIFHAGTGVGRPFAQECIVTTGGRVFGVTGIGKDLKEAQDRAYRAVHCLNFDNAYFLRTFI